MTVKAKLSSQGPVLNSLAWHKAKAAESEAVSAAVCLRLGLTPADLRQLAQKKKAH